MCPEVAVIKVIHILGVVLGSDSSTFILDVDNYVDNSVSCTHLDLNSTVFWQFSIYSKKLCTCGILGKYQVLGDGDIECRFLGVSGLMHILMRLIRINK